jgi:type II secretory pathway pseudopilin PulG
MINRLARRIACNEQGLALPVAVMVLSVMGIISAYAFASANQVATTSNTDRNAKRAFQAAETALQVATYRVNNLAPLDGYCVTDVISLPAGSGGCTATGQLADGATWEYHMTPVLLGGQCAGYLIAVSTTGAGLAPRCITATGTVNGVKRRTQARVVLFKGEPIFPVPGIICLTSCEVVNAAQVNGTIGSNGNITLGNSSTVTGGLVLAENTGSFSVGNSGVNVNYRPSAQGGFVLTPVEIGNTATVNDNGAWTVSSGANFSYGSTYREMSLTKGTLTLHGGTYNLCSLTIGSNAQIVLAAGAKARLFIDSPERGATSGCRAGTGYVDARNNFVNPGNPEDLQLYVYGADPPGRYAVDFTNAAELNMAIHAPRATVYFKNQATLAGGVNANKVIMKNTMSFAWGQSLSNLTASTTAILYQRTAWRECRRQPTTSDPTSGC